MSQQNWNARAKKVLPAAGFGNFDADVVISHGKGSRVWDEDGKEYIDYLIGSGPMLVGHGHPEVLEAVQRQLTKGMTFFANNAAGIELAEEICNAVPCAEQLRYVSTGGEADMYAMRIARAFTGREKIMKFEGGYHGMSAEALMSLAPQQLANFPQAVPDSAGIPKSVQDSMVIAPFNDIVAVRQLLDQYDSDIAAIIVEPLQRLIPPQPGFLQALRDETRKRNIVLIFDEVVTGFRFSYGGAQQYYGVTPDICTLGKVIGGGFPMAAIAGSEAIMRHFDKDKVGESGFTIQVGTLSGNPVAAVAGLKTLEILRRPGSYEQLKASGERIMAATEKALGAAGVDHQIVGEPMLFDVLFTASPVKHYRDVLAIDEQQLATYNQRIRAGGVFKSAGKTYPSLALDETDLQQTESIIAQAAAALG